MIVRTTNDRPPERRAIDAAQQFRRARSWRARSTGALSFDIPNTPNRGAVAPL